MEWQRLSRCRDLPYDEIEIFFPVGTTGFAAEQVEEAKNICSRCPVEHHCLHYALDTDQDGVWGGTTMEERVKMKRVGVRS